MTDMEPGDRMGGEAQVITRGRWTRLDGTDAEILVPLEGGTSGGPGGSTTFTGGAGISASGGAGGIGSDALVVRVRQVS